MTRVQEQSEEPSGREETWPLHAVQLSSGADGSVSWRSGWLRGNARYELKTLAPPDITADLL